MERSERKAAENEIRFRSANESIDERRQELGLDGLAPYICECESDSCTSIVRLAVEEYRSLRAHPSQFVVVTGHPARGDVIAERDGYAIVQKTGLSAELARRERLES